MELNDLICIIFFAISVGAVLENLRATYLDRSEIERLRDQLDTRIEDYLELVVKYHTLLNKIGERE